MKQILNTLTFATLAGLASLAPLLVPCATASPATDELMRRHITDERAITLHFGDLDPRTPADASELVARVKLVARNACLRNDERRQIFLGRDRKHCVAQSYASAIAGINAKRNVDLEALALRHDAKPNLSAAR